MRLDEYVGSFPRAPFHARLIFRVLRFLAKSLVQSMVYKGSEQLGGVKAQGTTLHVFAATCNREGKGKWKKAREG